MKAQAHARIIVTRWPSGVIAIVVLALMIGAMIAIGDPDGLLAPIMVFSPVVLMLVAVLIVQRSRRSK
jgi:hypothetical protein